MGDSLRDQLLKAGLVSAQQTREARTAVKRAAQERRVQAQPDPRAQEAAARAAEKAARDRELNRAREAARAQKALYAQLRDLLQGHRLNDPAAEVAFHFQAGSRVKRLYVTAEQQRLLTQARLVIAWLDGRPHLVPAEVGEKVRQLLPKALVFPGAPSAPEPEPDDPYAAYQVPDDLRW